MKTLYKKISFALVIASLLSPDLHSQCPTTTTLGQATNMVGMILNGTNPVAADKSLNMISYIHRHHVATFGGNSGNLRFDYSTNGGTNWTLNVGPVNPASTNYGRYPQGAIYNPANNTNPANAYVSYLAPTISTLTGADWMGLVTGVSQLS